MVECILGKMKTIMFLGAGEEQCEAIDIALDLGLKIIAVDGNPNACGFKKAHVGIHADIKDVEEMIGIGKKYKIDGVMTHAVEIPQIVAKIAKALGLPGLDPDAAERATNKLKRIKCLTEHGIPCPKFETAKTLEEARLKAEKIGFPCVFKPIDSAGARGVIKVNNESDVKNAFNHTISYTPKMIILLEEYLKGKELSTESVIYNNAIYTVAFADRNYDKKRFEPFFIEDGGEMPTSLSKDEIKKVTQTVNSAIKTLGINWGVAKGDIIIDHGKVKIIEMAARTSGGRFCSVKVPLSTGINILRPLILMAVGVTPDLNDLKHKFIKGIAERFIFPEPGKIVDIKGIDEARKMEGVDKIHMDRDVKIGGKIKRVTDHTMRKGYVMAIGKTRDQAVKRAEDAVRMIKIKTIN
jgi:biotin carboxylase